MAADQPPAGRTAEEYLAAAAAEESTAPRARRRATPTPEPAGDAPKEMTPAFRRLHTAVLDTYTAAQMGVHLVDPVSAAFIGAAKEQCTDAWLDLAQRDPKVKRLLEKMTSGAGWGGVIMAHMGLFLPIMSKFGFIPGGALFDGALMNAAAAEQADPLHPHGSPTDTRLNNMNDYFMAHGVVTVP